jgi:hypothetical protein
MLNAARVEVLAATPPGRRSTAHLAQLSTHDAR